MRFETKITRQSIPQTTLYLSHGGKHVKDMSVIEIVPPDDSGDWRYREMRVLNGASYMAGYTVMPGSAYSVPPNTLSPETEMLVIWERYEESE